MLESVWYFLGNKKGSDSGFISLKPISFPVVSEKTIHQGDIHISKGN